MKKSVSVRLEEDVLTLGRTLASERLGGEDKLGQVIEWAILAYAAQDQQAQADIGEDSTPLPSTSIDDVLTEIDRLKDHIHHMLTDRDCPECARLGKQIATLRMHLTSALHHLRWYEQIISQAVEYDERNTTILGRKLPLDEVLQTVAATTRQPPDINLDRIAAYLKQLNS